MQLRQGGRVGHGGGRVWHGEAGRGGVGQGAAVWGWFIPLAGGPICWIYFTVFCLAYGGGNNLADLCPICLWNHTSYCENGHLLYNRAHVVYSSAPRRRRAGSSPPGSYPPTPGGLIGGPRSKAPGG
eukprot:scaffold185268_cov21-Tisochrysis_lutea.AAC.1